MLIQLILISVFLVLLARVIRHGTAGKLFRGTVAALIILACYVVVVPSVANKAASFAGVGRGADLIMYICMAGGAYLATVFYLRMRQNELNMARMVQELALEMQRIETIEIELQARRSN